MGHQQGQQSRMTRVLAKTQASRGTWQEPLANRHTAPSNLTSRKHPSRISPDPNVFTYDPLLQMHFDVEQNKNTNT